MNTQYAFPARLNTAPLPVSIGVDDVRELVAGAQDTGISIDETAVEILSPLVGVTMRPSQIRAVLPAIHEQLAAMPPAPQANTGALSQTDIFGGVLGISQFMLHTGGGWLFASIPISNSSSPDLYAIREGGKPWYVELKGIAPLSNEVAAGTKLDVCSKVTRRVAGGLEQLDESPEPGDGPQISISSSQPVIREAKRGGRALSAIIVPDGYLAERLDLKPVNRHHCPTDRRCTEQCLRSSKSAYRTSLVGLLWLEENKAGISGMPGGDDRLLERLASLQSLNIAVWAGSRSVADASMSSLVARVQDERTEADAEMLSAALTASRGMTSRRVRQSAADLLGRNAELEQEADLGFDEMPRLRDFNQLFEEEISEDTEFSVRGDGYFGVASFRAGELRTAPAPEAWIRAARSENSRLLLQLSEKAMRDVMLRTMLDDRDERLEFEDVSVNAGDSSVIVGRQTWMRWPPNFMKLPHVARWEFAEHLRRGDIHMWCHRWESYLSPISDICTWADRFDWMLRHGRGFLDFDSRPSWASFDGRITIAI